MAERIMSDAEIKRRKKVQGHVSQATGALGLTAFGGALAASRTGRKALRTIPKLRPHVAEPAAKSADKVAGITTPALAAGGGLGALGSFNFASYTGAESRKRTPPVKKNYEPGIDMGYFGEEGHPVKLPPIKVPIEKAWSPVASNYNSERDRGKRNEAWSGAALAGAGAAGTYGGAHGVKAISEGRKLKTIGNAKQETVHVREVPDKSKGAAAGAKKAKPFKEHGAAFDALDAKAVKGVGRHAGKAAAGLAVAGGAVYGAKKIKEKHGSSWTPYAKRDSTSAFGVDHGVEFGKDQEHWTTKSDASKSRIASGILFAGPHGLVAGKPGKKLKAAGHEVGGALVGSPIAGPIGSSVGAGLGTRAAQNKGYYKRSKPIKTTAMKTRELHASLEKEKKEKGH